MCIFVPDCGVLTGFARQTQKGTRRASGTVPAAVSSENGFESIAIGAFGAPRRPEPGEVRRPAAFKLNKVARGQAAVKTLHLFYEKSISCCFGRGAPGVPGL